MAFRFERSALTSSLPTGLVIHRERSSRILTLNWALWRAVQRREPLAQAGTRRHTHKVWPMLHREGGWGCWHGKISGRKGLGVQTVSTHTDGVAAGKEGGRSRGGGRKERVGGGRGGEQGGGGALCLEKQQTCLATAL